MIYRSIYRINVLFFVSLLCLTQCLFSAYGTLELAIYLKTPKYQDFNTLINLVHQQETVQQKNIITKHVQPKDLHLTLTYPLIPLDDTVINRFPRIKRTAEQLPYSEQANFYHRTIPIALSKWLTTHLTKTFSRSDRWRTPIALPFTQLQKLGNFLSATFSLDKRNRLVHIVKSIDTELKKLFYKTTFAFDTIIPHLSLGIMNPLFNPTELMQPKIPIAPLMINKKLGYNLVVSARMKKEG